MLAARRLECAFDDLRGGGFAECAVCLQAAEFGERAIEGAFVLCGEARAGGAIASAETFLVPRGAREIGEDEFFDEALGLELLVERGEDLRVAIVERGGLRGGHAWLPFRLVFRKWVAKRAWRECEYGAGRG